MTEVVEDRAGDARLPEDRLVALAREAALADRLELGAQLARGERAAGQLRQLLGGQVVDDLAGAEREDRLAQRAGVDRAAARRPRGSAASRRAGRRGARRSRSARASRRRARRRPRASASRSACTSDRPRSSLRSRYELPSCSSPAPSWYLPESRSCSTKPCAWSVCSSPWTVGTASSSRWASSVTPRRRGPLASVLRMRAARSIDWIPPRLCRTCCIRHCRIAFDELEYQPTQRRRRTWSGSSSYHIARSLLPASPSSPRRWPAPTSGSSMRAAPPDGALGTDEGRVRDAIRRADGGDGVVVLGDLGSAILTIRHVLDSRANNHVTLIDAPIVEGDGRSGRHGVRGQRARGRRPGRRGGARCSQALRPTVTLPADVALHARPAAQFVRTAVGFAADIAVAIDGREADAKSLLAVLALGAEGGTRATADRQRRRRRRSRSTPCATASPPSTSSAGPRARPAPRPLRPIRPTARVSPAR